ncbi:hypothetical protein ACFX1Q_008168 [Malus domestica]
MKSSAPFVFSRADEFESARTPGLFKPLSLISVDGKTSCSAVDGGLAINNPTMVAVTHVLNIRRDFPSINGVENLLVLSVDGVKDPLTQEGLAQAQFAGVEIHGIVSDAIGADSPN